MPRPARRLLSLSLRWRNMRSERGMQDPAIVTAFQRRSQMQVRMIGLGRMVASIVRRLLKHGHECVIHYMHPSAIASLAKDGATGVGSFLSAMRHEFGGHVEKTAP